MLITLKLYVCFYKKIVWRSGPGNQQMVSRGSSPDCRQDTYNDQSMTMPGIYSGTARYCCRSHLCNSVPTLHEIFHSFTNLNSYIDNILLTYPNYRLKFQSITKKELDLTYQRIVPDQVIEDTVAHMDFVIPFKNLNRLNLTIRALSGFRTEIDHRVSCVHKLSLFCVISLRFLEGVVDLTRIQQLIVYIKYSYYGSHFCITWQEKSFSINN
ncbi:hypothetical protein I4U23_030997 [Adineta vaga]|nr:hypothetical protein I4U23_030997 [Adineta vaga]